MERIGRSGGIYWQGGGDLDLDISEGFDVDFVWIDPQSETKTGDTEVEIKDGQAVIVFGCGDRYLALETSGEDGYRMWSKFPSGRVDMSITFSKE